MYKQRTLLAVLALIGVISTFLPWIISAGGLFSFLGISSPLGMAVFFLTGGSLVLSLSGNRQEPVPNPLIFMILGALITLICIVQFVMTLNSGSGVLIPPQAGIGLYIEFLSGIAIAGAANFLK